MYPENQSDNLDSRIKELESQLCILAMEWRSTSKAEVRQEIKEKYHSTVLLLFSLGWNDYVDLDCELPTEDMPQEYFRRHPDVPSSDK